MTNIFNKLSCSEFKMTTLLVLLLSNLSKWPIFAELLHVRQDKLSETGP